MTPNAILVKNTCELADKQPDGTQWYYWSLEIETEPQNLIDDIEQVTYHLHPTFTKTKFEMTAKPFTLKSKGWGEFIVKVEIHFKSRSKITIDHRLLLKQGKGNITRRILY